MHQELVSLILTSDLSPEEKDDFLKLFYRAHEDTVRLLIELFEEDRKWVRRLYENFKAKREALKQGKRQLWDKAVRKEIEILQELI